MENDDCFDQNLLQQFSCMGTTDKDELVRQMQILVNSDLHVKSAEFFLEMSNWNLQAAINLFLDINSTNKVPSMIYIDREPKTIDVPPETAFKKQLYLQNNGDETWPVECCLRFVDGLCMSPTQFIPVGSLAPRSATDVDIVMISPKEPGVYLTAWRMSSNYGFFGESIHVFVNVSNQCVNGLRTQFSHISELGASSNQPDVAQINNNPFTQRNSSQEYQESCQNNQDGDNNMMC